jgi:tetratricopeptide (TPR) repeat protein
VLLAREVAHGVRATTQTVAALMAKLERENAGDRENSLYASVELSLRRLPEEFRERVNRLAVVHGGGQIILLALVMGIEVEEAKAIAVRLIEVGMAEEQEYGYLRLDPALPAYLQLGQPPEHLAQLTTPWAEAMVQLVDFLVQQMFKDSRLAFRLTLLELPNLMALLDHLGRRVTADSAVSERVAITVGSIEQLLANLNRPQALARAVALRQQAAVALPEWGKARFANEHLHIERLLGQGQLQSAYDQAQALLAKAQTVGPTAYSGADFDLAMAHFLLGRVLGMAGQAAPALELFVEAQRLFEGIDGGARMASLALTEQADCLAALGRLEDAAAKYEERIRRGEGLEDFRGVAVGKGQLADVLRKQGRYEEAIAEYAAARTLFEQQNEPQSVAVAWHQTGRVYQDTGQYDAAEAAYRQSLEIMTRMGDLKGQGKSLTELGSLYCNLGRLEEALVFYKQRVDVALRLNDLMGEGLGRQGVALVWLRLDDFDEARKEIKLAATQLESIGFSVSPWKALAILHLIEISAGNLTEAWVAWQQARDAYLAYRQQGGYAQSYGGKLVDHVLGLLAQQQVDEIQSLFEQLTSDPEASASRKQLIQAMVAILNGSRDPALADDPTLDYDHAAEVLFFQTSEVLKTSEV